MSSRERDNFDQTLFIRLQRTDVVDALPTMFAFLNNHIFNILESDFEQAKQYIHNNCHVIPKIHAILRAIYDPGNELLPIVDPDYERYRRHEDGEIDRD